MSAPKQFEITCWRAKFLGEIRVGNWEHGVFNRIAGVPVNGEFITKRNVRTAEKLRDTLNAALKGAD